MKQRIVFRVLGYLMLIIALGMVPPLLIAFFTNQSDFYPS